MLWNTVYLERHLGGAARHWTTGRRRPVLPFLSPLGWEHINPTGDYLWRSSAKVGDGKFTPLRPLQPA